MEGNRRNVRTILTHTGKIYVDIDNQLEFLTVGDYGKENNIKADFLGLTKEIHGVENTAVDLSKKWVATISTQKGCPMHCKFCDVPKFGFYGNASIEDMESGLQITGYTDYDVYRHFEQPLLEEGWDVIVFVPSKEEDSDRITCGNALIAFNNY